ncbi:MAG: radical SAM protein [Planctomycetota bacterium]
MSLSETRAEADCPDIEARARTATGLSSAELAPTHDFTAKLTQPSLQPRVADYVSWQRAVRAARAMGDAGPEFPDQAPLSINLDLTTACNYRCDHCIDWDILNSPIKYQHDKLRHSLTRMAERGLKSVIIIGGGEPTIYPGFADIVRLLKRLDLQVAIVSNGSRNDVVHGIFDLLDERDWLRLSLDSGSNETFWRMHRPVKDLSLDTICSWVPKLRARNESPLIGFSFIIVWDGAEREEGVPVVENIHEIVQATRRARDFGFSYISLKPFLSRRPDGAEVMDPEAADEELDGIVSRIRAAVNEAKTFETESFKVTESINLRVLETGSWRSYTRQPSMCHMQAFRQVLTPLGLYNCPAHRGVEKARLGESAAYSDDSSCAESAKATAGILERFDAAKECSEVTCLYNSVNWWLEAAIRGEQDLTALGRERFDHFL